MIRDLIAADRAAWSPLWQDYLGFYEVATMDPQITETAWHRLTDPVSRLFGRVAVAADGTLLGFAHCVLHEATWCIEPICYLEDLFVTPEARGRNVGKALIDDLLALCQDRGWGRLYWHTNTDNEQARRLYDRFRPADDYVRYRIHIEEWTQDT
ncbi:MAG: GNAT family N-acetyltransferase [Rhodospirillaceae bacterium]